MVPLAGWRPRLCLRCLRTSRPDNKISPRKHGSSSPLLSPLSHPDFLKELMTNSVSALSCPAAGFPVSSVSTRVVTVPAKVTRPSTSALLVPVHPSVWPPSPPPYPDQKRPPASPLQRHAPLPSASSSLSAFSRPVEVHLPSPPLAHSLPTAPVSVSSEWPGQSSRNLIAIQKSVHAMHHAYKLKEKNDRIVSTEAEKAFDEIQSPL